MQGLKCYGIGLREYVITYRLRPQHRLKQQAGGMRYRSSEEMVSLLHQASRELVGRAWSLR